MVTVIIHTRNSPYTMLTVERISCNSYQISHYARFTVIITAIIHTRTSPYIGICLYQFLIIAYLFTLEGRIWDLIVSVPDHCLSFYFAVVAIAIIHNRNNPYIRFTVVTMAVIHNRNPYTRSIAVIHTRNSTYTSFSSFFLW